ncbi:MAG: zinc dependent phospholipase C family protein [Chloroflexi bacterium]|nr:zinc dependent phospholipase C family protein [Chloroflexota bacterium]
MPTPFTHLRIAQRLLTDERLAPPGRALLRRQRPAFQLGSIVADARVASGVGREVTHFYKYGVPITERPWRLMLRQHPSLCQARDDAHRAFLAGYVAHLAADETWALKMVRPHFWGRDWPGVERWDKFFALHLILTVMDERDEPRLEAWQAESLARCEPSAWLPFMSDETLRGWRDLVARQIAPGGRSQTLSIFATRLKCDPAEIRAALDDPARLEASLWRHIPKALLAEVERQLYDYSRDQLAVYLEEFAPARVSP